MHSFPIYVRFADTDAAGHVNNSLYASYGEAGRIAYLGELGIPVEELILARIEIDYRRPLLFGEQALVETIVEKFGRTSITVRQKVMVSTDVVAELRSIVVLFDYASAKPVALSPDHRASLEAAIG